MRNGAICLFFCSIEQGKANTKKRMLSWNFGSETSPFAKRLQYGVSLTIKEPKYRTKLIFAALF